MFSNFVVFTEVSKLSSFIYHQLGRINCDDSLFEKVFREKNILYARSLSVFLDNKLLVIRNSVPAPWIELMFETLKDIKLEEETYYQVMNLLTPRKYFDKFKFMFEKYGLVNSKLISKLTEANNILALKYLRNRNIKLVQNNVSLLGSGLKIIQFLFIEEVPNKRELNRAFQSMIEKDNVEGIEYILNTFGYRPKNEHYLIMLAYNSKNVVKLFIEKYNVSPLFLHSICIGNYIHDFRNYLENNYELYP